MTLLKVSKVKGKSQHISMMATVTLSVGNSLKRFMNVNTKPYEMMVKKGFAWGIVPYQ